MLRPQVLLCALSLLFAKLIVYTLGFWLPQLLALLRYSDAQATQMSALFDAGSMAGAIAVGACLDRYPRRKNALLVAGYLLAVPLLVFLARSSSSSSSSSSAPSSDSETQYAFALLGLGACVNVPYVLISSVVSTELQLASAPNRGVDADGGAHVLGLVNGVGGLGAAAQGPLTGALLAAFGLQGLLYALAGYCAAGALALLLAARCTR